SRTRARSLWMASHSPAYRGEGTNFWTLFEALKFGRKLKVASRRSVARVSNWRGKSLKDTQNISRENGWASTYHEPSRAARRLSCPCPSRRRRRARLVSLPRILHR